MSKESEEKLTLRDLEILMEAHKNNIELTTSIALQQKQILDSLSLMVKSANDNKEETKISFIELKNKIDNIDGHIKSLEDDIDRVNALVKTEIETVFNKLKVVIGDTSSSLRNYIYGSYVIMLGIIGTLIAILEKLVK